MGRKIKAKEKKFWVILFKETSSTIEEAKNKAWKYGGSASIFYSKKDAMFSCFHNQFPLDPEIVVEIEGIEEEEGKTTEELTMELLNQNPQLRDFLLHGVPIPPIDE